MINIGLIGVILALAVLLLRMDFSLERVDRFLILYHKSLSDLEEAKIRKIEGKIVNEETDKITQYYDEGADKINEYYNVFKKGYERLRWSEWIKQCLPILVTVEILHVTLQEFGWSLWYEWIYPGLNGRYVVVITVLMLLYLVLYLFRITDKKILELEFHIISVIAEKIYGFI